MDGWYGSPGMSQRRMHMGLDAPDSEELKRKDTGVATKGTVGPAMLRDNRYLGRMRGLEREG